MLDHVWVELKQWLMGFIIGLLKSQVKQIFIIVKVSQLLSLQNFYKDTISSHTQSQLPSNISQLVVLLPNTENINPWSGLFIIFI